MHVEKGFLDRYKTAIYGYEPVRKMIDRGLCRSLDVVKQVEVMTRKSIRYKEEVLTMFAKAYLNNCYGHSEFFDFIKGPDLKSRLTFGHYHSEEDFNNRPMTKSKQDLWEQTVRGVCFYDFP